MIEDGWRLFTLRKAQEDMLFGYLLVPFSCCFLVIHLVFYTGFLIIGNFYALKK